MSDCWHCREITKRELFYETLRVANWILMGVLLGRLL